jgi:glycosyltransferase involved in cell wall biosynthesis
VNLNLSAKKSRSFAVRPSVEKSRLTLTKEEHLSDFLGRISIVMPAYNEGSLVFASIKETAKVLREANCDFEIIVVDDGSRDNTHYEVLRAKSEIRNVRIVRVQRNLGKGNAIKEGCGAVTGDIVVFLDADLDLHPAQINVLFDYLVIHDADVVIGSKRHPDSKLDYPWYRKVMSDVYYVIVKSLFGLPVRDTQTGIKLFRQEVLQDVLPRLVVKKYAFDLELLVNVHNQGFKIKEAPISLKFQGKFGRIRLKDIYHTFLDTLAIFYRLRILKYYDNKPEINEAPDTINWQ